MGRRRIKTTDDPNSTNDDRLEDMQSEVNRLTAKAIGLRDFMKGDRPQILALEIAEALQKVSRQIKAYRDEIRPKPTEEEGPNGAHP